MVGDGQRLDPSADRSRTEPWSLKTRILLAVPGVAAAAVLVVLGVYILVANLFDLPGYPPGDDGAALLLAVAFLSGLITVVGLLLGAMTVVVCARRPRRWMLVATAVLALVGAALVATDVDRSTLAPLLAAMLYVGIVAIIRLALGHSSRTFLTSASSRTPGGLP